MYLSLHRFLCVCVCVCVKNYLKAQVGVVIYMNKYYSIVSNIFLSEDNNFHYLIMISTTKLKACYFGFSYLINPIVYLRN